MEKSSLSCPYWCPDSFLRLMLYLDLPMAYSFFGSWQTTLEKDCTKDSSLVAFRPLWLLLLCSGTAYMRLHMNQLGSKKHIVLGLQYLLNINVSLLDRGKYRMILGHCTCMWYLELMLSQQFQCFAPVCTENRKCVDQISLFTSPKMMRFDTQIFNFVN